LLSISYWCQLVHYTNTLNIIIKAGKIINTAEESAAKRPKFEAADSGRSTKKQSNSAAEALEIGLVDIKDGLVSLGNSLASTAAPSLRPANSGDTASLGDVLRAIKEQSSLMAQLMAHLANKKV
jgi:flagellar basal body rod protein FlgG